MSVPCPRCGATAPAGLPRDMTLLAIDSRAWTRARRDGLGHVESRCPAGHEVHVYYRRRVLEGVDGA